MTLFIHYAIGNSVFWLSKFVHEIKNGLTAEYPATYFHKNSVYCFCARSSKNAAKYEQWWQGILQLLQGTIVICLREIAIAESDMTRFRKSVITF